jgi:quercetin dioxygenase-like cupin family protein
MKRKLIGLRRHAVFQLAPDLLLVFKPRGHREDAHGHPHRQRLRVLSGLLEVRTARQSTLLRANSPPLTLAAGRTHATVALRDTWLVAECCPPKVRPGNFA